MHAKQISQSSSMLQDEYLPIFQNYVAGAQARGQAAFQRSDEVAAVVIDCKNSPDTPLRIRISRRADDRCSLKVESDPTGT